MAVALAALLAVSARAREPDVGGFRSYSMPGYTIVTHDEKAARQIPTQIAMIDGVLEQLLVGQTRIPGAPTFVIVAPQKLWNDYLQPSAEVVSEFMPGRFVNYMLLVNCRCDAAFLKRQVYHEYAHLFLHAQFRGILPLWFDEGMAGLVERTEFRGSRAILGQPTTMSPGWMDMDDLLRLDRSNPGFRSAVHAARFHDQSWALVHRGIVADREFGQQMFAYLTALDDMKTIDEAVQSSFGKPFAQFSKEHYAYTSKSVFETIWLDVGPAPQVHLVSGREMSQSESIEMLADAMFVSGSKRERILRLINSMQKIAPHSAGVRVLRLRLASRDRDDRVIDFLLEKLERDLADPRVARGVGLALVDRLRDRGPEDPMSAERARHLQERALHLLDVALRATPEDPEAAWAFGIAASDTQQLQGTALQRLLTASETLPMNADIASSLALVYASMGKSEKAGPHLRNVVQFSRSMEQRKWARGQLEELARR
jgi:hypothetical protein